MYVNYIAVYFPFLGCMYMPVCMQDSLADQPHIWAEDHEIRGYDAMSIAGVRTRIAVSLT